MGIEDWVLKGTKLITNTKKQRLKIQSLEFQKYNIKKRIKKKSGKKKSHKNYIYVKFAFKKKVFFFAKQQQVIKVKIKGVIEDLKFKKKI